MSPNDHAGRISKRAFLVSTLALFTVVLISVFVRFYIRVRIQKQVSIDDGFLLFGLCCLISSIGLMFTFLDNMYMTEAVLFSDYADLDLPSNWLQRAFDYRKMIAPHIILTWCSIASVKFSFLFLFRRLIDRIQSLRIYWWIVLIFNIAVSGYGAAVYIVSCPHFYDMRALECGQVSGTQRTVNYSASHMALDIIGDLLILYLPVRIIWQIRIRWTQKAVLTLSLCLTAVIIIFTVIKASGLRRGDKIDTVWETFWQMMTAEVGLIMTSITAFRVLFVARNNQRGPQRPQTREQWSSKKKLLIDRLSAPSNWRKRGFGLISGQNSGRDSRDNKADKNLPSIPRATMTGIRTFINGQGSTEMGASQMMQSHTSEDITLTKWGDIEVQHEILSESERVRGLIPVRGV